ncbi:DUF29 domain-containing protein [Endozoicomonas sp. ONNA1]|uniref:DUF29 domain-containing protein n=1 Tax=Endozoicomonas sp. ONNA1 TaxID=2828740 RepID=UPI002147575E|nr:DUF29 domain-containing protein [Endozoicomonas sp. ONNA1]
MTSLYHTDPYKWLSEQVNLLANKRFNELDIENLIEELELNKSDKIDRLESQLKVLIQHLLKMEYQTTVLRDSVATERVLKGWRKTVRNTRDEIKRLLKKYPTVYQYRDEAIAEIYADAKRGAIDEMNDHLHKSQKLINDSFPKTCPWDFDTIIKADWYPLNGVEIDN